MKARIIIIMAMLAAAIGAQAQYGSEYYHRTGDTVYNKSVIGYYYWWDFDQLIQNRDLVIPRDFLHGAPVIALQYFTVDTLKIVGIAGCPRSTWSIYELDTTTVQEYFYLFDNDNGNLVYKDRLGWDLRDPHRTLVMPTNNPGAAAIDSCCSSSFLGTEAFPLYEYYFDSAITVTDTFYIGWSYACHFLGHPDHTRTAYQALGNRGIDKEACDSLDLGRGNYDYIYDDNEQLIWQIFGSCAAIPVTWYKLCRDTAINDYPQGSYNWIDYPTLTRDIILSYPLIYIDTTVPPAYMCDPVQNFSVTVLDTGSCCVFFTWDDFYHYSSCEVQYYSIEQGYNHAVTTTVTGNNMLHLCGFDSTLTYYARMRAICDTSKTETEWTSWVNFTFPHTNPQGIDAVPSKLDRYTHLMPNPAADKVTVTSELGLRRIEVYNARGILVYSEPAGYSATTIDLHGWPAGQYLMTIETLQGKTAKRLVVAR